MLRVLIATSNQGKLRDFAGAAKTYGISVSPVPGIEKLPAPMENGATFEENARKKAEYYSRYTPGELVLADDSGLEVDALNGAPGIFSARYASSAGDENASDAANNARLLRELKDVADAARTARFVCAIAAAKNGRAVVTSRGEAHGHILPAPRGAGGFGYDPLFLFPELQKTFAELSAQEKARVSHRGKAFREFLEWFARETSVPKNLPRAT